MKKYFALISLIVLTAIPGIVNSAVDVAKDPNAAAKIVANLPIQLTPTEKDQVSPLIEQSLAALRSGDGKTGVTKIHEVQAQLQSHSQLLMSGSPWISCGDYCMRQGDPVS
jgi:hypothetical protein